MESMRSRDISALGSKEHIPRMSRSSGRTPTLLEQDIQKQLTANSSTEVPY
ncbi:hypothetical protein PC116_g29862 [Phytophthora cactorum]|nr:hypothetical protein PC116_g29862 [Phytophthora cactorum]